MPANTVSQVNFRKQRRAAWWLIVVAFVIPTLGYLYGAYDDIELAFTLVCAVATLIVIAVVAWTFTRMSSPRTKAYVMLTVGLLICLNTSVHLFNDIRSHEATPHEQQMALHDN
jgi:FtsH-binding integral membrane protein